MKEQEMIFGSINYWEGPLTVKGKVNDERVSGKGFAELVGYPAKKFFVEFYKPELKRIRKMVGGRFVGLADYWVGKLSIKQSVIRNSARLYRHLRYRTGTE